MKVSATKSEARMPNFEIAHIVPTLDGKSIEKLHVKLN